MTRPERLPVRRLSLSLSEEVVQGLQAWVQAQGYDNRSQAVADMIRSEVTAWRSEQGQEVMAGTITLVYDEKRPGLMVRVAQLLRAWVDTVISNLTVYLENQSRMEVLVVQGPVARLHELADSLKRLKGIETGKLTLTSGLLPPVHAKTPTGATP